MVRDWLAHLGQAWNDEGLRGLLRPANWLPGVCRGLVATAGGQVRPRTAMPHAGGYVLKGTVARAWGGKRLRQW